MNNNIAVRATHLYKRYQVYQKPVDRLKEVIFAGRRQYHREFTALSDINLEVARGSTLGIVGPNGAGKSTLLKILAGIVEPSAGSFAVTGQLASIIELGVGFHPEFTGRENLRMNASLLGFSAEQIDRLYDRVIRFSELGAYIDMPLKTYSSGMIVRLAFSIAINVEPQVLLIDEALAVGDAIFAHRCLGKIRQMQERGVTILFVSHDVNAVANLCDRAIYMDKGKIVAQGEARQVVQRYQLNIAERLSRGDSAEGKLVSFHEIGAPETSTATTEIRFGTFEATINEVIIENAQGQKVDKIGSGDQVCCCLKVHFKIDCHNPVFGIMIKNRYGTEVFGTNTYLQKIDTGMFTRGELAEIKFQLPINLCPGIYSLSFAIHTVGGHFYDYRNDCQLLEVVGPQPVIGIANLPIGLGIKHQAGAIAPAEAEIINQFYSDAPQRLEMREENGRFLIGDWYWAEFQEGQWQRWTGKQFSAYLHVPTEAKSLVIKACSHHPRIIDEGQKLKIMALGKEVGEVTITSAQWQMLRLDITSELNNKIVRFDFGVDSTFCLAKLNPSSHDERELGVLVNYIGIE